MWDGSDQPGTKPFIYAIFLGFPVLLILSVVAVIWAGVIWHASGRDAFHAWVKRTIYRRKD